MHLTKESHEMYTDFYLTINALNTILNMTIWHVMNTDLESLQVCLYLIRIGT